MSQAKKMGLRVAFLPYSGAGLRLCRQTMAILASDTTGILWLPLCALPLMVILTVGSFIASAYGHWSGVVLAAPTILFSVGFTSLEAWFAVQGGGFFTSFLIMLLIMLSPAIVNGISVWLWWFKSRRRKTAENARY
jgi:hypothetical protein